MDLATALRRNLRRTTIETPVGPLELGASPAGLAWVRLSPDPDTVVDPAGATDLLLVEAARQLDEYFAGRRLEFDLPLDLDDTPTFDRSVYDRLLAIDYGSVATYGQVAQAIGSPGASRGVGAACNRNPLPIVVPCHRVVASDGTLGGYGGGLPMKRWLLALERAGDVPFGGWELIDPA